jgi:hypothetical protein
MHYRPKRWVCGRAKAARPHPHHKIQSARTNETPSQIYNVIFERGPVFPNVPNKQRFGSSEHSQRSMIVLRKVAEDPAMDCKGLRGAHE